MFKNHSKGLIRIEGGFLVLGVILLGICVYLLATMDQRVRAADKIEKSKATSEKFYRFADLMAEVYVQIQDKYVEPIDADKVFEAALNGMFDALDRHSGYLGPENFKELEKSTEGEFSGVGIHIDSRDGILTVVSPIPGTPAARAGVMAWDRIVEINGKSTENMTTQDAVNEITGPVGTKVKIVVYRESEHKRIPFTMVRDQIKIESIYSNADDSPYVTPYFKYLLNEKKIGYARITKFSENATQDLSKAIDKMMDAGVKGLILDVRFNSGGLLDEAVSMSNLFLPQGSVVVATKGRLADQNKVYKAEKPQKVATWPIILLVNKGSASASEILAGALKDHQRGVLLGANSPLGPNTYGKGSVQTILPLRVSLKKDEKGNDLPNALRLTTAKYYTPNNIGPNGKSIHGIGIEPDVAVDLPKGQAVAMLTEGLMLGDPKLLEPGKGTTETLGTTTDTLESTTDTLETELFKNDEKPATGVLHDKNTTGTSGAQTPFYLKKKQEARPQSRDVQLKYGVDLMEALLISRHEKPAEESDQATTVTAEAK